MPDAPTTKELLLDVAERLFAEHGIARSSLRAITQAADANLASVHYHFGSKASLVRAVFARRIGPLNQERLERLDALEGNGSPTARQIIEAFFAPVARMMADPGENPEAIARLVGRVFSEPGDEVRKILVAEFQPVVDRFVAAFTMALPEIPSEEIFWRFHFMVGSMIHTVAAGSLAEHLHGGDGGTEALFQRLVTFAEAGMANPVVEESPMTIAARETGDSK
ncbi:MAG: TetR/AcrR family transcriptional regulator [Acidobacteriota bacterium]